MAEKLTMPKLGFDMQEGTLANWVKKEGDTIQQGDVIVEVETDKATVEVEAFTSGTILKLLVHPGDIVEVGAPIAIIGEPGEDIGDMGDVPAAGATESDVEEKQSAAEAEGKLEQAAEEGDGQRRRDYVDAAEDEDGHLPGGVKASPVARRMAQDRQIDLKQVQGSGPHGRIIKRDVEGFQPGQAAPAAAQAAPGAAAAMALSGGMPGYKVMTDVPHEEIALSRMRGTIARRMIESKQWVPHFTVTMEVDVTEMLKLRKQVNATLDEDSQLTVNDLILKAVALTLKAYPNLNTHFHGDKLIRYKDINIGIAVALPQGGLINVVARNADTRSLSDIARYNKEMIARAREGKVKGDDVEGSTFTVSNLGAYGVEHFTAIINPPEAGILAVGAAKPTPVVIEGELGISNRMKVTLSVDHRVSDGAEGAQFLKHFKELIESPMRMLV